MNWTSLKLWADDEEVRLHNCITDALRRLIQSKDFCSDDNELIISGKLRKHLYRVKKEMRLVWQLNPEVSSFKDEESPKPIGHPDFRFSNNTPEYDQYDYDIECKLVRVKRKNKSHDYCKYYVTDGIKRFHQRIYAQSFPPMGAIIGYVQEGDILFLLASINDTVQNEKLLPIITNGNLKEGDVTHLSQPLKRDADNFTLSHLWVDLR